MWGGKLLCGIKSIYVNSSACVRVKGAESKQFRIYNGVRQGWIMSPCLFNVYMDGVMKEVKDGDRKERSELPGGREKMEFAWSLVYR